MDGWTLIFSILLLPLFNYQRMKMNVDTSCIYIILTINANGFNDWTTYVKIFHIYLCSCIFTGNCLTPVGQLAPSFCCSQRSTSDTQNIAKDVPILLSLHHMLVRVVDEGLREPVTIEKWPAMLHGSYRTLGSRTSKPQRYCPSIWTVGQ